jgi:glycosyltransferase involved in cell wall biosynthesis
MADIPGKVCIIGSAYPLRGGLSAYNERLAREFQHMGSEVVIHTFSLQYPSFLFPGKTQYSTAPPPTDLNIKVWINSINPFNWIRVGLRLKRDRPDLIVIKFWIPFMGPCFGTILRLAGGAAKRQAPGASGAFGPHTKPRVVCIADNIIPHEKRPGDMPFIRYFLKSCDAVIAMSDKVLSDLRLFDKQKPALKVEHPLYDHFGAILPAAEARKKLDIPEGKRVLLFFGFIRKYKGLDILLEAVRILKDKYGDTGEMPLLVIAGEFYGDAEAYTEQIDRLGIRDNLLLRTDFIPDDLVKYYLSSADVVIQPYRQATQSGVTPLAYHFEVPMIVTNVGGLPELVPDGKVGIVAEPQPASIAEAIERFYRVGRAHFIPGLRQEKTKYSWANMVRAITGI